MIDPVQQTLLEGSKALAQSSSKARAWVTRVAQTAVSVSTEEHSLIEATRRSENLARKLQSSSSRRNSAGVFGPSQAGKSYLVSVLGKSKGKPLIVDFAGTPKNFIQEINPEGGKEATGLVTRFTIVKGSRDTQHPVELRLLTETDLVKIIGNSFLSDFDQNNRKLGLPPEDAVRALIAKLEPAARAAGPMHVDEIVMFDIGEYFRDNFAEPIKGLLNAGYFDALARFGHRLPTPQRIELYSVMWGLSQDLTDVFALLQKALEELGHPATGRSSIGCLVPRARSIIDVDILKYNLGTPEDALDTIDVVPELPDGGGDGPTVQVPRATLTALVAEIKVVMADKPWPFFDHTDLLDFPGARSREKMFDLPSDPQDRTETVRNMLLRGKIAYLFQRYTDERELTCILLCMPPSNQEVKDLTMLVAKWVDQTHGTTPEARAKLPCGLFFVLTKFDYELEGKPGDTPESWLNRIDTRLEASMYQLYKQSEWLQNWNGKPFANTFFLRNPDYKLPSVFTYDPASPTPPGETGVQADAMPRITANRKGMVENERCQKHFASPELAWDSAMLPNDGGVTFLVDNLERVLSPRLKTNQLAGRLNEQAVTLDSRMRRFYQADDDASRDKKEAELEDLRMNLYELCAERNFTNFVQLLSFMKIDLEAVRGAFLNVASLRPAAVTAEDPGAAAKPGSAAAAPAKPAVKNIWKRPSTASAAAPSTAAAKTAVAPPRAQRDRTDMFAMQVLNMWTERVRGLSANTQRLAALGLDARLASDLGNELVIGAHRNQLMEQIATRVRSQVAAANVRWDEVADRSAGIATTLVNDFVAYLGFGELPVDKRPAVPEAPDPRERGVFASPVLPARGMTPTLGDERAALEGEYFYDWGVSLKQLGLDNMTFSGGREIDEGDNRALGQILADMAPALQVMKS